MRALILGIAGAVAVAGCSSSTAGTFTGVGEPTAHHIRYFLRGSARSADLTLSLGAGGQSQQQGVDVPLYNNSGTEGIRFDADDGAFLYISAQNNGGGSLTCFIVEDGATIATNTSRGQYAIVTCEGSA